MTENIENLVLEQLRHIRAKVDKNELVMDEVKNRLTRVELAIVSIKRDFADSIEDQIRTHVSNDRICARLDRIEKRLDLQD